MTDPVLFGSPNNEEPLSERSSPRVLPTTKTQLGEGDDPYALIDELGIPRDHPFLLLADEVHERSKRVRRAMQKQSDPKT